VRERERERTIKSEYGNTHTIVVEEIEEEEEETVASSCDTHTTHGRPD